MKIDILTLVGQLISLVLFAVVVYFLVLIPIRLKQIIAKLEAIRQELPRSKDGEPDKRESESGI